MIRWNGEKPARPQPLRPGQKPGCLQLLARPVLVLKRVPDPWVAFVFGLEVGALLVYAATLYLQNPLN